MAACGGVGTRMSMFSQRSLDQAIVRLSVLVQLDIQGGDFKILSRKMLSETT